MWKFNKTNLISRIHSFYVALYLCVSLIFLTWRLLFYLSLLFLPCSLQIVSVFLYFIFYLCRNCHIKDNKNRQFIYGRLLYLLLLSSFVLVPFYTMRHFPSKPLLYLCIFLFHNYISGLFHTQPAIIVRIIIIKNQKYYKIKDLWFQCNLHFFLHL